MCLRPHRAGSTIPCLRPTGSSLGIAPVDYDPVVLLKPFGPRLAAGAPPSRASSKVAPGRPIRVPAFAVVPHEPLHTFHPLWPVRRYPHLRISVRGPGPSGTSTHLTRQLPGTHSALVGQGDQLLQRLACELARRLIRLPWGEACRRDRELQQHATPVGDEGVAVAPARAYRDQRKAATEERVPRISDLDLDRILIRRVVEGGINGRRRSTRSTTAICGTSSTSESRTASF